MVWRTENYGTAFNWSRVYCKRDKELSFGHVMFVTAVRHLSRDVKKAVGYLSVQFWDFCARRYKFENYQNICVYMYMHLYIYKYIYIWMCVSWDSVSYRFKENGKRQALNT